jgi:L,D-peptidoglycan transpeptidase YkuD (ErfK/YbiS/YcfS/YnhG family)
LPIVLKGVTGNKPDVKAIKTIIVRKKPGNSRQALVQAGPYVFMAALGRGGIASQKREGDGCTPRARMALLHGFFRREKTGYLGTRLSMQHIDPRMLWCDEPSHACYNRLVRTELSASHERMLRKDALYDICLVMDWNISSRTRKRGSAIFFHLARPGYLPTEGCVAISRKDMMRLVRFVKKGTIVRVM